MKIYSLKQPFLDIGCGTGDVSAFFYGKGWQGLAIDFSDDAIAKAKTTLSKYQNARIEKKDLFDERGAYNTVFALDCLEHMKDDCAALEKIATLVHPQGYLVLTLPSNPTEWRWDDEFYGHYRRYTKDDLEQKLKKAGFTSVLFWDFTFPFFWAMRRLALLLSQPKHALCNKEENTKRSALNNFWSLSVSTIFLDKLFFIWKLVYAIQFTFFKNAVCRGHEMMVVAQRNA